MYFYLFSYSSKSIEKYFNENGKIVFYVQYLIAVAIYQCM